MLELLPDLNAEIIFITAHEEYAIKAFSQNVAGYILKPIDDKIFAKTLDKTVNNIKFRKQSNTIQLLHSTDKNTLIGIHNNNDLDYVSMQEILYFEANMRYTRIVTNAKVYTSSYSIGKFRTAISGHDFFQIHRSFIINLNHVRRYQSPDTIILDNGHKLPISKSLKGAFLKLFHIL
jgi:two-component system LytT family response regulator